MVYGRSVRTECWLAWNQERHGRCTTKYIVVNNQAKNAAKPFHFTVCTFDLFKFVIRTYFAPQPPIDSYTLYIYHESKCITGVQRAYGLQYLANLKIFLLRILMTIPFPILSMIIYSSCWESYMYPNQKSAIFLNKPVPKRHSLSNSCRWERWWMWNQKGAK